MVKDAETNASADKEKRERIDLKNQAETLVYQAEKQMTELADKVDADAKAKVEEKRVKLKDAVEADDYDAMKTLLEELQQELYTVGASVYQQDGAQAGGAAPEGDAAADGGVGVGGGNAETKRLPSSCSSRRSGELSFALTLPSTWLVMVSRFERFGP